jgi:hypothetical protein
MPLRRSGMGWVKDCDKAGTGGVFSKTGVRGWRDAAPSALRLAARGALGDASGLSKSSSSLCGAGWPVSEGVAVWGVAAATTGESSAAHNVSRLKAIAIRRAVVLANESRKQVVMALDDSLKRRRRCPG